MTSTTQKYFNLLCELRRSYKFEIVAEESQYDPVISYEVPSREESAAFLEFLQNELALYSTRFINRLQIDKIILGNKIHRVDQPIVGCASMSLFPDSLPLRVLFRKNTIYLAADQCNTVDGRICIHHELFHAIEAHEERWPKYFDPIWPNLNPRAFRYKEDSLSNESYENQLDCDGFLSSYSMRTVREDKAELFSHMVVNFARVEELASKDKFLRAKTQRMKQILKAFNEEFDESFWRKREQNSLNGTAKISYEQLLLRKLQDARS